MIPSPRPQRGLFETLFLSLICFHSIGLSAQVSAATPRNLTVSADIASVNTLKQNWTDAEGSWFYNVPQGSRLIPYDWFLNLEQVDSQAKFRDAEHMRALGYLTRTPDGQANPDGLPIGFVKDGAHLGLTCAACHTAQINYQGRAWLIDGAPTLGDIEKLHRRLVDALEQTARDDAKFARFANAVLGERADEAARAALPAQVQKAVAFRKRYHERNFPGMDAPPFGPGRVDAFGAIMNEVAETFAQAPNNHSAANAPVSYPFLWDTPQHDHVQWNGSAENKDLALLKPIVGTAHVGALGRNVGEVLGVFGAVSQGRVKGTGASQGDGVYISHDATRLWKIIFPAHPSEGRQRRVGHTGYQDDQDGRQYGQPKKHKTPENARTRPRWPARVSAEEPGSANRLWRAGGQWRAVK